MVVFEYDIEESSVNGHFVSYIGEWVCLYVTLREQG